MDPRFSSRISLTIALLSTPTLAQTPWGDGVKPHCLDFSPENKIDWPTALGSPPSFGRVVVADLDGDFDPEGIVVANGALVVLWNVESYEAPEAITFPSAAPPVNVRDAAALALGSLDEKDAVLMTDGRGLLRVDFDPLTRTFLDPVVLSSAWANAVPIHADDLDGDGDLDVIGVSSDKRQILRLIQGPSGFTPAATIPYPFDILDAIGVNWDGDPEGTREPVALTRRGVVAFLAAGTMSHMYLAVTGCIARLRFEAQTGVPNRERVAWSRPTNTTGCDELVVVGDVVSPGDDGVEGPWPLSFDFCEQIGAGGPPPGPIQPTAILSGNYDLDDNDDLLLVHQGSRTAIVLQNLVSPSMFDTTDMNAYDVVPLATSTVGTAGVGIPAFVQLDQRTSDDIVVPVGGTAKVLVFESLSHQRAISTGQPPSTDEVLIPKTEFGPGTSSFPHGTLRLAFRLPAAYQDYTHVDVVIFRQSDISTAPVTAVDQSAIYYRRHPLYGPPGDNPEYQWVSVEFSFPDGAYWVSPRPAFYVELRFALVVDEPNGTTVTRSPKFQGAFTLRDCVGTESEPCTPDYSYLAFVGIPGTLFVLKDGDDLEGTPEGAFSTGRTIVGSFAPMSSNPPFTPGTSPSRGTVSLAEAAQLFAHQ